MMKKKIKGKINRKNRGTIYCLSVLTDSKSKNLYYIGLVVDNNSELRLAVFYASTIGNLKKRDQCCSICGCAQYWKDVNLG